MVDQQAKTSLSFEPTSFKILFSHFKPSTNKYILEEWQTSWNNSIGNKLLDIKPTIGEYQSVVRNISKRRSSFSSTHIHIQGNEMVDKQAKTSLSLEPTSIKFPFPNFKPSINKYILEEWQT